MSSMFKKSIVVTYLIFIPMITINAILVDESKSVFSHSPLEALMKTGASLLVILAGLIVVKVSMKK